VVIVDEVAALARTLPRSEEAMVRGRLKFRVRSIVWLAFSADGAQMGFAFSKEIREALVATYPEKYLMPKPSDLRFNWVVARLAAIEREEMREIVLEAWRMVVPKKVALAQAAREERESEPRLEGSVRATKGGRASPRAGSSSHATFLARDADALLRSRL
jgi:hypothetical protein